MDCKINWMRSGMIEKDIPPVCRWRNAWSETLDSHSSHHPTNQRVAPDSPGSGLPGPTHPRCIRGRLIPLRDTSLSRGLSRATNCREYCRDLHCELGDSCAWMREVQQLRVRTNALTVRCAFRAVVSVMLQKGKSNNKRSRTFSRTRIAIEGAWHSRERVQDSGKLFCQRARLHPISNLKSFLQEWRILVLVSL